MDDMEMLNRWNTPYCRRIPVFARLLLPALLTALILFQPACSKKGKPASVETSPVRLVILPFNVPPGDKNLQWAALAAPIMMAKAGEQVQGLEVVPLWEAMPFARDSAGTTRTFTPDASANVASWVSAKWSVLGELSPAKKGVSMIVDFIPARSNQIAFRYLRTGTIDSVGEGFPESYSQFLQYLVVKPLPRQTQKHEQTMTSMKSLAEAIDREYGWFVEAEPGKAQDLVAELLNKDAGLARFLFSPNVYPSLAAKR